MSENNIIPVLVGADLNCYNVARAFHERYGIISYAFGRYAISATKYSKIISFTAVSDLDNPAVLIDTLNTFAKEHPGKRLILFACTDDYAALIIKNRELFDPAYEINSPSREIYETLSRKADFYTLCDKHGILYPKTVVFEQIPVEADVTEDTLGFGYPLIVKPSDSALYWKHPFDGMKKVYVSHSPAETVKIIGEIYGAGYPDKIIVQKMVPGGDSCMRVLTAFSDQNGKVKMMCLGHVMIEEHTPKGLGNHAAIIGEKMPELTEQFRKLLEDIGYTGFSNFDIKYDETDGTYRAFEINLRQGRSNFYITANGVNLAGLVCGEDLSKDENVAVENGYVTFKEERFWHLVPKSVAYTYTEDRVLADQAKALAKAGKSVSSLWYKPDFKGNPLRFFCVLEQLRRQKKKFKKYYPVQGK